MTLLLAKQFFTNTRQLIGAGAVVTLMAGTALAPNHAWAQNSLSRSETGKADNILGDGVEDAYLKDGYYQELINNKDIYGQLPSDMRRIFARIRFIALSIDDNAASDQVLNALTRAYLLYGMEAAAINEAWKIILPEWKARTLMDISDYYQSIGNSQKAVELLEESLIFFANADTSQNPFIVSQFFYDVASRFALIDMHDRSKQIIEEHLTEVVQNDPISQISGYLQIAERVLLGEPTNSLIQSDLRSLAETIRQCIPENIYVLPDKKTIATFSGMKQDKNENAFSVLSAENALGYLNEAYDKFLSLTERGTIPISRQSLNVLLLLNAKLVKAGQLEKAEKVLWSIQQRYIEKKLTPAEQQLLSVEFHHKDAHRHSQRANSDEHIPRILEQIDNIPPYKVELESLRSELIHSYINMDSVQEGMELVRSLANPIFRTISFISAGKANNNIQAYNTATSLFNYAQDITPLIYDTNARDLILREVVRGQAEAQLYGSAFHNSGLIRSKNVQEDSLFLMAQEMIKNRQLSRALLLVNYIRPHDLRIRLLSNLMYIRGSNTDDDRAEITSLPTTAELFEQIINIMKNREVENALHTHNSEPEAVLMSMCANSLREDLKDYDREGAPVDQFKKSQADAKLLDAVTEYVAQTENTFLRAESFGIIAQALLENQQAQEAQIYLDTAWNLAWSVRNKNPARTDKIFLKVVHGKIVSNQITDAFNVATGMGTTNNPEDEVETDPLSGNTVYSDRILALMDFSRSAMSSGEYGIALRAIEDIQISSAKSQAMTDAIRDLIVSDQSFNFDRLVETQ